MRDSPLTIPKDRFWLNRSLLTFRSKHDTSLVLQLDISSRASLRDNFLNISPRVHAPVTKKRRTCSPPGRICIWFLWARCLDSPRCFVFSFLAPRVLTSDDDCLIRLYDELPIATPIGHFLMVHLFYLIRSGTDAPQPTELSLYHVSASIERKFNATIPSYSDSTFSDVKSRFF